MISTKSLQLRKIRDAYQVAQMLQMPLQPRCECS